MLKYLVICLSLVLLNPSVTFARGSGNSQKASSGTSGHYHNGSGSSHRGGAYKNPSTNDHYRKRPHS